MDRPAVNDVNAMTNRIYGNNVESPRQFKPEFTGPPQILADKFGVSQSVIKDVQLRKTWKHVP